MSNLLPHLMNQSDDQQNSTDQSQTYTDPNSGTVNTMFGRLPTPENFDISSPEMINKVLGNVLMGGNPEIGAVGSGAAKAYRYINPQKDVQALQESMGSGNAEENVANIASKIQQAGDINKQEALSTKQQVLDAVSGVKNMFEAPKESLPEGNISDIASVFNKDKEPINSSHLDAISTALRKYRKNGDSDKFIDSGEDLFNTAKDLTDSDRSKIEDMISVPMQKESQYMDKYPNSASHPYDRGSQLEDLHSKFIRNPTFENSDNLSSEIGMEIGGLQRLSNQGKLDREGLSQLKTYNEAQRLIRNDQDSFLENMSPELKDTMDRYRQQWRQNVVPYSSTPTLKAITRERQISGITPSEINSDFAFPRGQGAAKPGLEAKPDMFIQKIVNDIGEPGRNAILKNKLLQESPKNANELVDTLKSLRDQKGYSNYISDDLMNQASQLAKRQKIGDFAKAGMGGALGDLFLGPLGGLGGAALGYGLSKGLPHAAHFIAKFAKKG